MLAFKIPKPITIIGDHTNTAVTFASCNFCTCINFNTVIEQEEPCDSTLKVLKYLNLHRTFEKNIIIEGLYPNNDFAKIQSAVFGGLNYLTISDHLWFSIKLDYQKEFFDHIMLYEINKDFFEYDKSIAKSFHKIDNLEKMVADFYDAYQEKNWVFLGQLINAYWKIKRDVDPASKNAYIEKLYSDCRLNGAIGGKMDGSLMLLFVKPENQDSIKSIMKDHVQINSSLDLTGIIHEELFSGNSNCCK
jgi:hypothetical protein